MSEGTDKADIKKDSEMWLRAAELLEQGVTPYTCIVLLALSYVYGQAKMSEYVDGIVVAARKIALKITQQSGECKASFILREIAKEFESEGL